MIPIAIGAGVVVVTAASAGYAYWRRAENDERVRAGRREAEARRAAREAAVADEQRRCDERRAAASAREWATEKARLQHEQEGTWGHIARLDRQMTRLPRLSSARRRMGAQRRALRRLATDLEVRLEALAVRPAA